MEEDKRLEKSIGDKEPKKLEAKKVKIVGVKIIPVEKAKAEKVVFIVKHPDQEDKLLEISSAKIQLKDKLKTYGLWYKEDEDGNVQKGSTIAAVLEIVGATSIKGCEDKEIDTVEDDAGYLTLRAYK